MYLVKSVYRKSDGVLLLKTAAFDNHASLAAPHELVAIFVFFDQGEPAQQFAEEFSGHEVFSVFTANSGVSVNSFDAAPDKARQKHFGSDGVNLSIRDLPSKAAAALQQGTIADVYEGGDGNDYDTALAAARTLAEYPPS